MKIRMKTAGRVVRVWVLSAVVVSGGLAVCRAGGTDAATAPAVTIGTAAPWAHLALLLWPTNL